MRSALAPAARAALCSACAALGVLSQSSTAPGFQVAPAFVATSVAPGTVATVEFEFIGTRPAGVTVPVRDPLRVEAAEFVVTPGGSLGYTAPEGWRNSARPWLRLDGTALAELTSERAVVVPVRVEAPASAAPGTYFAALEIRPLQDPARANITLSPRAMAPMLVEVAGVRMAVRATVTDPVLALVAAPATPPTGTAAHGPSEPPRPEVVLSVTVTNGSNFAIYPRVKATLRRDGRVLDVLPLQPRGVRVPRLLSMVVPWGTRPFDAQLRRPIAMGPCIADLYLDLGPAGQFRTSVELEVAPGIADALRGAPSSVLAADVAAVAVQGDETTISSESIEVTNVTFDATDVRVESSAPWLQAEPATIRALAAGAARRVRVRVVRPPTAGATLLEAKVRFVPAEGLPLEVPVRVRRLDGSRAAGGRGGR